MKPVVAVDLDGVLAHQSKPFVWHGVEWFGKPFNGAKHFLERLSKHFTVLIYSCRGCSFEMTENRDPEELYLLIANWLQTNELPYDNIYVGQGKPNAEAYIDDKAVSCRPQDCFTNAEEQMHYKAVVQKACRLAHIDG